MVIATTQLHSTKSELRFCAGFKSCSAGWGFRDGEVDNFWQWSRLEIRLNAFNWPTIPQKQFIINSIQFNSLSPWCSGYHYCTTSFNKDWTQVLHSFKSCSRSVGDSRWWRSLTMAPAGNKAKRLSSVNHTTKSIHHHISFAGYSIKQNNTVEYLGCQLDSRLRGEALALKVLRKINAKLKFLYQKSKSVTPTFRGLLGNVLIQPH